MKIGFVIYQGMTALDFIGVYDPITRLKTMGFIDDLSWDICALAETVKDFTGLRLIANRIGEPLQNYQAVIVPGGLIARKLVDDADFISWIKSAAPCPLKISVCTGSLLLGAAGFLANKNATTHPSAFKKLEKYCANVLDRRIVDEGDVITARGVTSAIDLGLYLCQKFAGEEAMEKISQQMDYASAKFD
jgi:cyclohexyl-isocyanide hydratase